MDQRGYKCYNPLTKRVIISRHVYFDETCFPFVQLTDPGTPTTTPRPPCFPDVLPVPMARRTRSSRAPRVHAAAPPEAAATTTPTTQSSSVPRTESTRTPTALPSTPAPPVATSASASPSVQPATTTPPQPPRHHMVTRARDGIRMPNPKYANVAAPPTPSPPPSTVRAALRDMEWRAAMQSEFDALQANGTWTLVPQPPNANIITGKWIFKNKLHPDGSLERRKARWVVRGFSQRPGVDFHQTFSPVVKPTTIRTVLQLAASRRWPVHQLDVKNAFLHGDLAERVYCFQPAGFADPGRPDHVCLLVKSLYGLKQAPRVWFQRLGTHLRSIGLHPTGSDSSLFVYRRGNDMAYVLVYVDDIIVMASTTTLLHRVINDLRHEFAIKDLGALRFFLGVQVHRHGGGFFLTQSQYTEDILERAGMANCKPAPTPVDVKKKLAATDGDPAPDATFYRSITGALQYLTLTRPDIAYAVNQACLYMHSPRTVHWNLVKRILRYLRGTVDSGIVLSASNSTELRAYSDADWGGCPDTRRSTSGYCVYLGDSLISWSSKRQPTVSRSSAEAEYRAVANAAAECCWLRNLLRELHVHIDKATVIYYDNVSAVYLSENPVHHRRTKHVELDIHFVREKVALGQFRVLHIPTERQIADVMTKGLPTPLFNEFRNSLCIRPTNAQIEGGCQRDCLG